MTTLTNANFVGMDVYSDPGTLPHGGVTKAYNMYLEGGVYKTRPAIVGLLTTAMTHPVYNPFPYIRADKSQYVIFCSGPASSTTGGKLYQVAATGGVPTEILIGGSSFDLDAEAFRIKQGGSYVYFCANGPLYRTDLTTATAEAITELLPPVFAPSASLSSIVLDALATATGWTGDTITSPSAYMTTSQALINAHADGDVSDGTSIGGTAPNTWTALGTTPAIISAGLGNLPSDYGTVKSGDVAATLCAKWFQLDDPGGGFQTGLLPVDALDSPEGYRNCTQFYARFNWYTADTTSTQSVKLTATAYDSSSDVIAVSAIDFPLAFAGQAVGQLKDFVFDFAGLGASIAFVQFTIAGGDGNFNTASKFPYVAGFLFKPVTPTLTFLTGSPSGVAISHSEPTSAYWGAIGGLYATRDYGSNQDWALSPVITFALSTANGAKLTVAQMVAAGLTMNLIIRQDGSTTEYTAPLTVAADGSYMTVDLSAYISTTIYSAFRYLSIVFASSLSVTLSTSSLFTITSITQAGNLPVSPLVGGVTFAPVAYYAEELDNVGDPTLADPIESAGSPVSNAIQPTPINAVGIVVFPAPVNANATDLAIFRAGGTYDDGQARLIATVPLNADIAPPILYNDLVIETTTTNVSSVARPFVSGDVGNILYILGGTGFSVGPFTVSSVAAGIATLDADAGIATSTAGIAQLGGDVLARDNFNPYISWNHTTRTLTDNTPDDFLNLALVLQYGRDLAPTICSVLAWHQNRLDAGSGQTASLSWDTVPNAQNGLYFTDADLSTDPNAQIKGVTFTVRPGDNDDITAMVSQGSSLITLKHRSAAVLDGYDPTNFADQTYLTDAGIGCIAGLTAICCGNVVWFLDASNVYQFNGDSTVPKSVPIQPLLHPNGYDGGPTIDPAVLAKAAGMYFDMRYHLFAPQAGDSHNTVDYVYDFRNESWSVWGIAMTSGNSLTGGTDADGAFMGGYDGQIYTFAPGGDKALPSSDPVPVPFTLTSRGMGEEISQYSPSGETGMSLVQPVKVDRAYAKGKMPASTTLTISTFSDDNESIAYSQSYEVSGRFTMQTAGIAGVQGTLVFTSISGAVLTQGMIRALGVEIARRKVPS